MKILITGGAGFVPSSLADALLAKTDAELVLVDNFLTGRNEKTPCTLYQEKISLLYKIPEKAPKNTSF